MRKITKKDIAEALTIINANFPGAYKPEDKASKDLLVSSWQQMLQGIPYEVFNQALMSVLRRAEFVPRIGHIVNECERIISFDGKTPEELWDELLKAFSKGERLVEINEYIYSNTKNRIKAIRDLTNLFNSLSEPNKRYCVDVRGFMALCTADPEFEKGRYLKSIKVINDRIRTEEELPDEVKKIVDSMAARMRLN